MPQSAKRASQSYYEIIQPFLNLLNKTHTMSTDLYIRKTLPVKEVYRPSAGVGIAIFLILSLLFTVFIAGFFLGRESVKKQMLSAPNNMERPIDIL
jgi:hypothetical protein